MKKNKPYHAKLVKGESFKLASCESIAKALEEAGWKREEKEKKAPKTKRKTKKAE